MTTRTPPTKVSLRPNPPKVSIPVPVPDRPETDRPVTDRPVVLAVVAGAHGIGGEVRLKVFADDIGGYSAFNGGALTLLSARAGGNGTIARFREVPDRTAAEALRGVELTVARSELPALGDGEYYHTDLLDLPVRSVDGEALGRVVSIENFGAGDVIEIERDGGKRFMVPMRSDAVPEWGDGGLVVADDFVD